MSEETIRTALTEYWREADPHDPTMMISRFVVVAEVIDSDGDNVLRMACSDNMPSWTRAGLLRAATIATDTELKGFVPIDEEDD